MGWQVTDLYLSAHKIGPVLERHYDAQALTVSMQDGENAGQSVPHGESRRQETLIPEDEASVLRGIWCGCVAVHVHVLPRKQGDFKRNDQVRHTHMYISPCTHPG